MEGETRFASIPHNRVQGPIDEVALSAGQGFAVRGTANLINFAGMTPEGTAAGAASGVSADACRWGSCRSTA
jgi:hypothetical protein